MLKYHIEIKYYKNNCNTKEQKLQKVSYIKFSIYILLQTNYVRLFGS